MGRLSFTLLIGLVAACGAAFGQSPTVLYTWEGTGDIREWASDGSTQVNATTLTNTIPGQLTVTEMGDPVLGDPGGRIIIRDGHNRRMESSTASGGLDVTGLGAFEIDVAHNGTGDVNVQFYLQATTAYTYISAGSNGLRGGPDFVLGPGMHTLQFPISILTPAEQAYIRSIGLSVRDHPDQGNLTWSVFELRTVGTPLTLRDLATHNVGTSDNGLNGAFANFDIGAIVGNDGGQNQTGLTQNTSDSGSLKWTDRGGTGEEGSPSGAAIGWGNGTAWNGNTFNERLTDLSNYTHVTYRISASDPLGAGGELGLQAYYQTGNFTFQSAGNATIPIDGVYHDVRVPLSAVTDRQNVQFSGINLFAHPNDLTINVDLVRYEVIEGLPGDYNEDNVVNAADYTVWRDHFGASMALPNEAVSPNVVDDDDYNYWKAHFGESLSGSGSTAASAVPEPNWGLSIALAVAGTLTVRGRIVGRRWGEI